MENLLDRVGRVGNLYIHFEIAYNSPLNKARPEEAETIWENKMSGFSQVHLKVLQAFEVCVLANIHVYRGQK